METILFFYRSNNTPEPMLPEAREYQKKEYRLVRIGLSNEAIALIEEKPGNTTEENTWQSQSAVWKIFRRFHEARKNGRRREQRAAERNRLLQTIRRYWGEELTTYCVCAPPVTYFNAWRFSEYRELTWMERLLSDVTLSHFLVLGYDHHLRELIFAHARRINLLTFCVGKQEYREELQELAEELYEEFGLWPTIRVLVGNENYRNVGALMQQPCNVLDFTGEARIDFHIVPPGSVWYDMDANEETRRRMAERAENLTYKSLTSP